MRRRGPRRRPRYPDRHFRLIGDGSLRGPVAAAAGPRANVSYSGWCDRDTVRGALDDCDVLVLSSRMEAFGTVALESMARERMALVSPACGIADWPEVAAGVALMRPCEGLGDARARLATVDAGERRARAARGRATVQALCRATRLQWLGLLAGGPTQVCAAAA